MSSSKGLHWAAWPRRREVEIDGWVHPDFTQVARALRRQLSGAAGGGAVCVYHRGKCVVDIWGGVKDRAGTPWSETTMAPSFSTTKGVASTLVHVFVDRGFLDYDDKVADYWPEFAQAGKEAITIRQIMSHQSGLYHIRQMIDRADRMLDWKHMIAAIERARPIHEPGTRTGYHGLTYGFLVGEILQRVTGKPFSRLVREEIAEPLGLDGMFVGAPKRALPRAAELMWFGRGPRHRPERGEHLVESIVISPWLDTMVNGGAVALQTAIRSLRVRVDLESILDALAPRGISSFSFDHHDTLRVAIPAANGLFTARSLARMYAALSLGGTIDGTRLMSRKTLIRATRIQGAAARHVVIPWDMRWRLGYHGVLTTAGIPKRAFGHFGFGGSGAWADPKRELAVALIVNSGMGSPLGDLRIARIGGAALSSALHRAAERRVTARGGHRAARGAPPLAAARAAAPRRRRRAAPPAAEAIGGATLRVVNTGRR
jgi:CubicO group peptidase (beta-lactamase class C family)